MRNLMLCLLVVLISSLALGQYRLNNQMSNGKDSLGNINGSAENVWQPTQDKMANSFFQVWSYQRKADTLKLRPGNYWEMLVDNKVFRSTLISVEGVGNFRKSNWQTAFYCTMLDSTIDTLMRVKLSPAVKTFPITMTKLTGLPESASYTFYIDRSQIVNPDSSYLTMNVFDADGVNEGRVTINGHAVKLWDYNLSANNGQVSVRFGIPQTWWLQGSNTLKFEHLSGDGFRIDTANVDFHIAPGFWYEKPTTVARDTFQLSYAHFGEVDGNGYVKMPSDSLRYGLGHMWVFNWFKYKNNNPYLQVVDSIHEEIELWPILMYGNGSTLQVQIQIVHCEIPRLPIPVAIDSTAMVVNYRFQKPEDVALYTSY